MIARNTDHTLIRVLNYTVVSAISTSAEVISNSIFAVLRHYIMILLTLVTLYIAASLRLDIDVVTLFI